MHEDSRQAQVRLAVLFDDTALEVLVRRARRHCSTAREQQHSGAEHQHYNSPPEVDIDTQRMTRVHLAASRRRSISTHQHTKHTEHHADGQSDIESHASSSEFSRPCLRRTHVPLFHHLSYQKIQLRTTRAVSTTTASTAGFWYHASPTSFGLSVSA